MPSARLWLLVQHLPGDEVSPFLPILLFPVPVLRISFTEGGREGALGLGPRPWRTMDKGTRRGRRKLCRTTPSHDPNVPPLVDRHEIACGTLSAKRERGWVSGSFCGVEAAKFYFILYIFLLRKISPELTTASLPLFC